MENLNKNKIVKYVIMISFLVMVTNLIVFFIFNHDYLAVDNSKYIYIAVFCAIVCILSSRVYSLENNGNRTNIITAMTITAGAVIVIFILSGLIAWMTLDLSGIGILYVNKALC